MRKFWDQRYTENETVYGNAPNQFFKSFIDHHQPGTLLLPAEGEGKPIDTYWCRRLVDGDVVIVTHGGVLDAIYRIALGLSMHAPRTWQLLNASVNQVEISFTAGAATWHLHDWADTRHLAEAEDEVG